MKKTVFSFFLLFSLIVMSFAGFSLPSRAAGDVFGICNICRGTGKCELCDPAYCDDGLGDGYLVCGYCRQTGYITCGTNTTGDGIPIGCDGSGYRADGSVCEVCGGAG